MVDKTDRRNKAAKNGRARATGAATEDRTVTEEEMAGRRIAGGRHGEVTAARAAENRYPDWTAVLVAANDDRAPAASDSMPSDP